MKEITDFKISRMVIFQIFLDNQIMELEVARINMTPFVALFSPMWDFEDVRHLPVDPTRPFLIEPVRWDEPASQGPTKTMRVKRRDVPPDGFIWVGSAYSKPPDYDLPDNAQWKNTFVRFRDEQEWPAWPVRKFEAELLRDRERLEALVPQFFGKTLLCWCYEYAPERPRCHAEVLAKYANALGTRQRSLAHGTRIDEASDVDL